MTEEFGRYDGGGGGNRTQSEAPIPEQDQGPASAEAGTEAVPDDVQLARDALRLHELVRQFKRDGIVSGPTAQELARLAITVVAGLERYADACSEASGIYYAWDAGWQRGPLDRVIQEIKETARERDQLREVLRGLRAQGDQAMTPEASGSLEAGTDALLRLSAGEQFVHFEEMTWPLPDEDLEWRVRYQTTFSGSHHRVASLLAAYAQLIAMPERKRRKVIKAIRTGQRMKLAASALLQAQP